MPQIFESPEQYLFNRINIDELTKCWNWKMGTDKDGYGLCYEFIEGVTRAHRFAYALLIAPIPNNKYVLHSCDNPSCCNPDHLFLGTAKDNAQDRVSKGRFVGEDASSAIYSDDDFRKIRELYEMGLSQNQISKDTGMSRSQVGRVIRGQVRGLESTLKSHFKYTDDQIQEVRRLRSTGLAMSKVAQQMGMSLPFVKNILYNKQRKP